MRRLCDLHTHSTVSDGTFSPFEVIALADRKRLAGIALTDHDTTDGLAAAASAAEAFPELRFIPGVEVSAVSASGTLHILGLCIDPSSAALKALLARLRLARDERNPKMIAKLQSLGLDVTMADVLAEARAGDPADRVVSRAHMAAALVRKALARDITDAFGRYIGAGAAGYVEKDRLSPGEVIAGIHGAGGLALVAHPVQLGFGNFAECERMVRSLIGDGLDGIEVYHSQHNDLQVRFFLDMARRFGLAVSGGSDFHGTAKQDVKLGRPPVAVAIMDELLARAGPTR